MLTEDYIDNYLAGMPQVHDYTPEPVPTHMDNLKKLMPIWDAHVPFCPVIDCLHCAELNFLLRLWWITSAPHI